MIPAESFRLEKQDRKSCKDSQRNNFLDYLELPKIERTAVFRVTDPIGRDLKTILKKCNAPAKQNDRRNAEPGKPRHLLKFQMSVPSEGHKDV